MTNTYREPEPVPGPEAFEHHSKNAQLSQAAFVLATSAGVAGKAEVVPSSEEFPLPDLRKLERKRKMSPERAMRYVEAEPEELLERPEMVIPTEATVPLAVAVYDRPEPVMAASLIEMCLHSPHSIVRTAAAAAALDTTGPREDVVAQLEEGVGSRDPEERDIARTALGRIRPDHPRFKYLRGRPSPLSQEQRSSHTAIVTHGTFASRSRWWRPGGTFYAYLDAITPSLHMHDESYQWSGLYSHPDRDFAADRLAAWIIDQGLTKPDVFAHSHGATVANLATHHGAEYDRLVYLSLPVHGEWFPDFTKVDRIIDVRVRFDLVIMADRGGQKLRVPAAHRAKVQEEVHGWFRHSDTHEPAYWDRHDLPDRLG